jgi:hypothetical protein
MPAGATIRAGAPTAAFADAAANDIAETSAASPCPLSARIAAGALSEDRRGDRRAVGQAFWRVRLAGEAMPRRACQPRCSLAANQFRGMVPRKGLR